MENNRTRLCWKNREQDLKRVKRYGRFSVMFYRTDLWIHSKRVELLLEGLISLATRLYPGFDARKAKLIARHHDDYELQPIGDVPLQLKLMMNGKQLSSLEEKEVLAAEAMARVYPRTVGGYDYLLLLDHAIRKDCAEAQLVSVADKCDGFCEAWHEVLAGNTVFLEPIVNYVTRTFNDLPGKYPLIGEMFSHEHDLLSMPVIDLGEYFANGTRRAQPHTAETIARKTGIPMYEEWKRITTEEFGVGPLVNQTEFCRAQPDGVVMTESHRPELCRELRS